MLSQSDWLKKYSNWLCHLSLNFKDKPLTFNYKFRKFGQNSQGEKGASSQGIWELKTVPYQIILNQ